jgi:hypothetical protein
MTLTELVNGVDVVFSRATYNFQSSFKLATGSFVLVS